MKKAIIFDLDGTLWDSSETIAKAWKETICSSPFRLDNLSAEYIKTILGKTNDEIQQILFGNLSPTDSSKLLTKCQESENIFIQKEGATLFENVPQVLNKLSENYDLYIVSNCQSGYIEAFLTYYNLNNLFIDIECSGNTGLHKAENIALIMERNSIKHAIYIGDTQKDFDATSQNNLDFVYAKYGFGEVQNCKYAIESFDELPQIVEKLL